MKFSHEEFSKLATPEQKAIYLHSNNFVTVGTNVGGSLPFNKMKKGKTKRALTIPEMKEVSFFVCVEKNSDFSCVPYPKKDKQGKLTGDEGVIINYIAQVNGQGEFNNLISEIQVSQFTTLPLDKNTNFEIMGNFERISFQTYEKTAKNTAVYKLGTEEQLKQLFDFQSEKQEENFAINFGTEEEPEEILCTGVYFVASKCTKVSKED